MRINKLWKKLFLIASLKLVVLLLFIKPVFFPKYKNQFKSKKEREAFTISSIIDSGNNNTLLEDK